MSTSYGTIVSAKFGNTVEVYTSSNKITLYVTDRTTNQTVKIILDEENLDDFIEAIYVAAKQLNLESDYLNLKGK